MDLIPLDGMEHLSDRLGRFAHTCDAICWHLDEEKLLDPLGFRGGLESRRLSLCEAFWEIYEATDIAYFALISLYLIIRHNLDPSEKIRTLINTPQAFTAHHEKSASRLARELRALVSSAAVIKHFRALDEGIGSSGLSLLRRHWQPSL